MQYSDKVMEHFMNPKNVGEIENASGIGEVGNAKCGDIMRIYLDIDPETQVINDVKFKTFGCGSACTSGSLDPSHVLMAIGLPHEIAHGSLRLSIGDFTTEEDIDYIIEKLPPVIERLRMMSPLYDEVIKQK